VLQELFISCENEGSNRSNGCLWSWPVCASAAD